MKISYNVFFISNAQTDLFSCIYRCPKYIGGIDKIPIPKPGTRVLMTAKVGYVDMSDCIGDACIAIQINKDTIPKGNKKKAWKLFLKKAVEKIKKHYATK